MSHGKRYLAAVRQEQESIFLTLDSGEVLELASASVPKNLPEVGESISSPLLAEIELAAERKIVARRLFGMLDRRLQPVARLRNKLQEAGFSDTGGDAVLQQMADQGLYSDRHYAEAYCRDCLRGKAVGRRYLEKKLWEKRVDQNVARTVPGEILDSETEKELALQAAQTKLRKERGSDWRKVEAKLTRYLVGRGFPVGVARDAIRRAKNEMQAEQ